MILGSATVAGAGLGLLDIALKDATLVSLAILDLGSGSRLGYGSLGEELCVTVTHRACRSCLVLSAKKGIRMGPSITPSSHSHPIPTPTPTLTSQHANTSSS